MFISLTSHRVFMESYGSREGRGVKGEGGGGWRRGIHAGYDERSQLGHGSSFDWGLWRPTDGRLALPEGRMPYTSARTALAPRRLPTAACKPIKPKALLALWNLSLSLFRWDPLRSLHRSSWQLPPAQSSFSVLTLPPLHPGPHPAGSVSAAACRISQPCLWTRASSTRCARTHKSGT